MTDLCEGCSHQHQCNGCDLAVKGRMHKSYTSSSGHRLIVDVAQGTLTIEGPTETMDCISDFEFNECAAQSGCWVDWLAGPLNETSYRVRMV